MTVQWYYGTGGSRHGPFSAQQLQALAAAGTIQPTDTVWKEGVAQGVPAHRVKQPGSQPPPKKGRAMAVRGAVIVSQDGTMVFYRKKCTQCGHEETGRNRLPIRNGVMRAGYFCPKCRKLRPVEIQGTS